MADLDSGIRALAQEFAAAVAQVVKTATLQAVAEVLADFAQSESIKQEAAPETDTQQGDESLSPPTGPSDRPTSARRPPPARRCEPREQGLSSEADRVLFYLRARPGERAETVRVALGLEREDLLNALQQLLARGKIIEDGERHTTKYWPA
jgi:hypothetical protein